MINMNANLLEQKDYNEAALSSFRKRTKILIFTLFSIFLILLALITTISFIYLFPDYNEPSLPNPAVESFCSVTRNNRTCFESLNLVSSLLRHPDHAFAHLRKLSMKKIENAASFLAIASMKSTIQTEQMKNCLASLQDALSNISRASWKMSTINHELTGEERTEMMNWFNYADKDMSSCYDLEHLVGNETVTAAADLKDNVDGAKMYGGLCVDYLSNYGLVLDRFDDLFMPDSYSSPSPQYIVFLLQDLFGTLLFVSQYLILFFLLCRMVRC